MRYTCAGCGATSDFPQWECGSCRADFCPSCAERLVQHGQCQAPIRPFNVPQAPLTFSIVPDE